MQDDPEQTVNILSRSYTANLAASHFSIASRHTTAILHRLDALIMAMKDCKGKACSRPWTELHPEGSVSSLEEALDAKYDKFYEDQPKMYFESCETAYIKEKESNEPVNRFGGHRQAVYEESQYGNEWILAV